jgi:hypothetical protein
VNPDDIGKPSQAALEMAERLREPTVPAAPPNAPELSTARLGEPDVEGSHGQSGETEYAGPPR